MLYEIIAASIIVLVIGVYFLLHYIITQASEDSDLALRGSECGARMKLVNSVCVPEVRYLSGFDYADCDQKYTWSPDHNAYINDKRDRALIVVNKNLVCHSMTDGKISLDNYGMRVIDVEVTFDEHQETDIPVGTPRVLSGFRSANCDGHYRWSATKKAFINDEKNRAITLDGPQLTCKDYKAGRIGGSFGTRVVGAKGVGWKDPDA